MHNATMDTTRRRFANGAVLTLTGTMLTSPFATAFAADDPSIVGAWSSVMPGKAVAVHAALLPSGDIAIWQDAGASKSQPESGNTLAHLIAMSPAAPGLGLDPDPEQYGRPVLRRADAAARWAGVRRRGQSGSYYFGIDTATIFDPATPAWINPPGNRMANPRWYPSVITLPNGEVLALSGTKQGSGDANLIPEVWNTAESRWRELTSAKEDLHVPLDLDRPEKWPCLHGRATGQQLPQYGRTGQGVRRTARQFALRGAGTFAVYGPGKLLAVGGGDANTYRTAEFIDLLAATPGWTQTGSMQQGRRYATATALPDATVLVTGGGENQVGPAGVLTPELWSAATGAWSPSRR